MDTLLSSGCEMYVLSNSSKRKTTTIHQLLQLGLDPQVYFKDIVTSGEVGWNLLKWAAGDVDTGGVDTGDVDTGDVDTGDVDKGGLSYLPSASFLGDFKAATGDPSGPLRAYIFGADRQPDVDYVEGTGCKVVNDIADADVVVARGTGCVVDKEGNNVTPKGTEDTPFYESKVREVIEEARMGEGSALPPMLCCNPDMIRPDSCRSIMPGALASWYEGYGGRVFRVGKPHGGMLGCLGIEGGGEGTWMVGDSVYTDLGFAEEAGIKGVWCWGDGIHGEDIRGGRMGTDYANGVVVEGFKDVQFG
ncbi:hypothetical protein TrRE_jg9539 [Triparma retinervis]|uniref:Uncharacterized protein n=1 Tax=Triparma retinervis TaxID=2557542 RepID=A0A9W7DY65_9STRA|nr:hypothetical protein TrRE_jg9539 [Triparma retinervis]